MMDTAKLYGGALYDLAAEEGLEARILEEMTVLSASFAEEPGFLYLLSTPSLSKAERCGILDRSFRGSVAPCLLNFMKILCENGTIRQFAACGREFRRRYNEAKGILEVQAVTAIPMDEALTGQLRQRLQAVTGKQIDLSCRVDPACLGGVRLELEGQHLDGTVQARLDSFRRRLSEIVL